MCHDLFKILHNKSVEIYHTVRCYTLYVQPENSRKQQKNLLRNKEACYSEKRSEQFYL